MSSLIRCYWNFRMSFAAKLWQNGMLFAFSEKEYSIGSYEFLFCFSQKLELIQWKQFNIKELCLSKFIGENAVTLTWILLLKLTPGVNFTNILRAAFCTKVSRKAFLCLDFRFDPFLAQEYWRKCAYKVLGKTDHCGQFHQHFIKHFH